MRKILFFVTGIGWGDAVRESAIIKELQKLGSFEIKIAGYRTSHQFFKNKFPTLRIKGFNTVTQNFGFEFWKFMGKNVALPLSWSGQLYKLKKELRNFKPDLVVTDFEPLGVLFARSTKTKFIEVFGVDPVELNTFLKGRRLDIFTQLQIGYLKSMYGFGNKFGEGVLISSFTKRRNFDKFKFINPIIRKSKNKGKGQDGIVVILGGSSFGVALGRHLARVLPKIKNEKFYIFGWSKKKKVKNCVFLPATENALEYIKGARGVISLSGHLTISEALVFKKPLLVFPIPNHIEQEYNAWLLEKKKLAKVKHLYDITDKQLEETINSFVKEKSKWKKRVNKANIKANGAKQAAEIIMKILK